MILTDAALQSVFIVQRNLNAEMVKQGWAIAYLRYSRAFIQLEDAARTQKLGLWAGEFQKPWDYRRHHPKGGR
jgi:endonuclease YncB( thermonuclease family)